MSKIGIILGYGKAFNPELTDAREQDFTTPYGTTSGKILSGKLNNDELFILQRHGVNGSTPSYKVNFKANIYALYELGCEYILATSVCGSLQEEICPGEFVIFDQFIDLTTHSELTFSDKIDIDKLNHSAFNKPFADKVRDCLIQASVIRGCTTHTKGIVMAVDGPRQSTRAESNLYRNLGADVINTTTTQEAILSHELNIQYGAISLCTYFDTWRTDIPPATRGEKLNVIELSSDKVIEILVTSLENLLED
jgi:5'-methylthioadenosine phosphorylase